MHELLPKETRIVIGSDALVYAAAGIKTQIRRPIPGRRYPLPHPAECPLGGPGDRLRLMDSATGHQDLRVDITQTWAESLQQITRDEVRAMGVPATWRYWIDPAIGFVPHEWDNMHWRQQFAFWWDRIDVDTGMKREEGLRWAYDPLVWVVTFRLLTEGGSVDGRTC